MTLAVVLVVISQIKINVTNAYFGLAGLDQLASPASPRPIPAGWSSSS